MQINDEFSNNKYIIKKCSTEGININDVNYKKSILYQTAFNSCFVEFTQVGYMIMGLFTNVNLLISRLWCVSWGSRSGFVLHMLVWTYSKH